ncbi:plasmid replication initiator TrfA, partial [Burkholderia sp. BCC0322]|uniref:plasmid replication initiator TrfA n=1 Tax=Burkholderia sp. BCC0322 TaxID=2676296 RepID=UPI001FC83069
AMPRLIGSGLVRFAHLENNGIRLIVKVVFVVVYSEADICIPDVHATHRRRSAISAYHGKNACTYTADMANSIVDQVKAIAARVSSTGAMTQSHPAQIPLWPENVRGMPNALARSALFNVNKSNAPRTRMEKRLIASVDSVEITFSGEELRQDDADVFLEVLHLARDSQLDDKVEFTGYSVLKSLGWGTSSKCYGRLVTTLERLQAGQVKVRFTGNKKGFVGSLIRKFLWKEGTEMGTDGKTRWVVFIEPEIVALFSDDDYTRLAREQRQRLRYELSKWLHTYYHTHAVPYAHSVRFLHRQCGSQAKALFHFRANLKKALDELVKEGFLKSWAIDRADLLHVVRTSSRGLITT